jgi:hypothetical protein
MNSHLASFYRVLNTFFCAAIILMIAPPSGATDPTQQPLLQSDDITYLGSFFVENHGSGSEANSFSWGGMGLAVSEDGKSLYVGGHVYKESLGRVAIPEQMGVIATLIQEPTYIPGSVQTPGSGSGNELAGALVYDGRLIVQKRVFYDTAGSGPTHASGNLDITGFTPFEPLANINAAQFANGYMGRIPAEWQNLLGGPAFSGNSAMSIVGLCSNGPSFYVFDPNDVGHVSPIPSIPLMYYPLQHPLANADTANDLFSRADQYNAGIVFPSGTRSILFFSRHGYGAPTYKQNDGGCGGLDGEGAAPYRRQVTAFDANDLLAVKNGTKAPYEVKPYAWWLLSGPQDACGKFAYSGLAYDPISRRIFAAFNYGESPEIHVWQVASGQSAPPPTAPKNLRIK